MTQTDSTSLTLDTPMHPVPAHSAQREQLACRRCRQPCVVHTLQVHGQITASVVGEFDVVLQIPVEEHRQSSRALSCCVIRQEPLGMDRSLQRADSVRTHMLPKL